MGQTTSSVKKEAVDMFTRFPKDKQSLDSLFFYVRDRPEFPFKEGHDDSALGIWYDFLPTTLQTKPSSLDKIIDKIIEVKALPDRLNMRKPVPYTPEQVETMYKVFKEEMTKILTRSESSESGIELGPIPSAAPPSATGGAKRRRRRGTKRANRSRRSSRKN